MTDIVTSGLHAVATHSALAYPLVFAAGALTGIGPCTAPRYVAIAALSGAATRPALAVGAFVAGLVGANVALGLSGNALANALAASGTLYAVLAGALGVAAIVTLWRGESIAHRHDICAGREGTGGAFLLGASSSLVVAPCCTPVLATIAGLSTAGGPTLGAATLLAAFALGHAAPTVAAGALGTRLAALCRRAAASYAPAIVSGALMLALAAYYGALA